MYFGDWETGELSVMDSLNVARRTEETRYFGGRGGGGGGEGISAEMQRENEKL